MWITLSSRFVWRKGFLLWELPTFPHPDCYDRLKVCCYLCVIKGCLEPAWEGRLFMAALQIFDAGAGSWCRTRCFGFEEFSSYTVLFLTRVYDNSRSSLPTATRPFLVSPCRETS